MHTLTDAADKPIKAEHVEHSEKIEPDRHENY
jgi:hypothetical protein